MSQQLDPAWFDSAGDHVSIPQALDNLQYRLHALGGVLITCANSNSELPETALDDMGMLITQLGIEVEQPAEISRQGSGS